MVSDAIAARRRQRHQLLRRPEVRRGLRQAGRSPQQKTVIVPAEMGALVGSIAGIGELVRAVQQRPRPPRRRRPAHRRRGRGRPSLRRREPMDLIGLYLAHPFWWWVGGGRDASWPSRSPPATETVAVAHRGGGCGGGSAAGVPAAAGRRPCHLRGPDHRHDLGRPPLHSARPPHGPDINDTALRLVGHARRQPSPRSSAAAGACSVDGKEWAAELEAGEPLATGADVEVAAVLDGGRLKVRAA